MKKISTILLTMLISTSVFANDAVLATYKGGEVKESEVMTHFKPLFEMQKDKSAKITDEEMKMLTQAFVNMKLLKKQVEESDIDKSKIVKEKLEEAKKQIVQNVFIDNIIKSEMTEKMIDGEYNEMVKSLKGKQEVDVSHILIETEETAQTTYNKLKDAKGSNFGDVAKEFSTDDGTKLLEGKLGFIREGQTLPEFEKEAFTLKAGEFSKPVKTQLGWHIIKVIEKRAISIPKKDDILPQIKDKLSKTIIENYIKELNKKADVKILIEAKPKEEVKIEDKNSTINTEKKDTKSK